MEARTVEGAHAESFASTFDYYALYIRVTRTWGLQPFSLERNVLKVSSLKGGLPYYRFIYNILRFLVQLGAACFLLLRNHSTNYQLDTLGGKGYLVQLNWICGISLGLTPMLTTWHKLSDIPGLFSDWLHLESTLDEILPESSIAKRKRLKFLRFQYMAYCTNVVLALLTMIVLVLFNPRFPPFLNSVWLPDPKAPLQQQKTALIFKFEESLGCIAPILTYAFGFFDFFAPFSAWQAMSAFDTETSMMARTISSALERMTIALEKDVCTVDQVIPLYHALRIFILDFNSIFAGLLFTQEMLNLCVNVICAYAAIQADQLSILLFFACTSFSLTLRMYLIYVPLVDIFVGSIRLRDIVLKLEGGTGEGADFSKRVRQLGATMRYLVVRPLGLHRITPTSITDYVYALSSYVVTARQA